MSGLLAGKVWQSNLDAHLKPLAAALADIANDDGTSIHPSVEYIAWLLGKDARSVQRGIRELKTAGVLVALKNERGGRNLTVHYRMVEANLPKRSAWSEREKGDKMSSFQKGDTVVTKGCHSEQKRVALVSPDPSLPVSDPPSTRAIGNGYKAKKPRRYEISEFENPDALDPDQSFRKYLQTLFPTVPVPEFYKKWYLSRLRQGGIKGHLGRGAPLEHYHADMEFFWGICAENGKQSNGNGHKRFEPEYTGPVKSKPNPKLENCPDCRGTGTILVEAGNGMKCAKVCKHERSEVVVA